MPVVLRQGGFRLVIYLHDHAPPHTHVFKSGETVILLGDLDTKPSVRENRGMSRSDERKALRIAAENQDYLLERWAEINGDA